MQDGPPKNSDAAISWQLHEAVDRMLAPFGKQSPRNALSMNPPPPFDVTSPNEHDIKAEFSYEQKAVTKAVEHLEGVVHSIAGKKEDPEAQNLAKRLMPIISQKLRDRS